MDYLNSANLLLCKEMIKAITFKKEYPWALAYPFIDEETRRKIYDFHPIAYNFQELTQYPNNKYDDSLWDMETVWENHIHAFVKQICGEISRYCIYRDEILCGFTFFGLKGCPYLDSGECSGSINPREGLQQGIVLDPVMNIAEGCSFGLFLAMYGIHVEDIDFQDIRTPISFERLKQIAKEQKDKQ